MNLPGLMAITDNSISHLYPELVQHFIVSDMKKIFTETISYKQDNVLGIWKEMEMCH